MRLCFPRFLFLSVRVRCFASTVFPRAVSAAAVADFVACCRRAGPVSVRRVRLSSVGVSVSCLHQPVDRAAVCARAGAPVTQPAAVVRSRRDRARARRAANLGWCQCGGLVRVDGFRSRGDYQEYFRSGLCQDCQDRTFLSFDAAAGVSHAVRRGLVVGAQPSAGAVAALPFVYTVPGRRMAWEARHCVLVGPEGSPCDPWGDLEPLADVLADHQIRVHEADEPSDPGVAEILGAPVLVLGPDCDVIDACASALPLPADSRRVALGDALPWDELCGSALNPLHRFALRAGFTTWREPDAAALRCCAWLAAALALLPGSKQNERVLDAVLRRFLPHQERHFDD